MALVRREVSVAVAPPTASRTELAARWLDRNLHWIFPGPAVLAMAGLLAFPLVYTAWLSLHEWYASSVLGPQFVGLKNYVQLLTADERFWPAFWRTAAFTAGSVVMAITFGLGIAH